MGDCFTLRYRMNLNWKWVVCLVFLHVQQAAAQTNQYQFSHLNTTNGLSHNQVNCIYKDSKGFTWFGTMSGLNRYDGYKFKIFKHNLQDSTSLNDDYISRIIEGPFSKLWIQTRKGFNIYDPLKERFNPDTGDYLKSLSLPSTGLENIIQSNQDYWFLYPELGVFRFTAGKKVVAFKIGDQSLAASPVSDIKTDSKGNIWVIHRNGIIEKIDAIQNKVVFSTASLQQRSLGMDVAYSLFIDSEDGLWIYSIRNKTGVYYYQPSSDIWHHFSKSNSKNTLNNDLIYGIIEDEKGAMWIATDHGGINVIDKKTFAVSYIMKIENDSRSIAQNSIYSLYKDNTGILWIGTYKRGISFYHEGMVRFPWYRHQVENAGSLKYDDVNVFVEDEKGNLWIGSNGGGLFYFNRKENTFKQYRHNASDPNSLSNDVIVSLFLDHQKKLWIGTYFGGLDCFDGKFFKHYHHDPLVSTSIADESIWKIYEDDQYNLWIGTLEKGLDRFDRKKNIFYHYPVKDESLQSGYISALIQDAEKNLWIGTSNGIDVLERKSGKFIHYSASANKLSNDNVITLLCDSRGNIWAGTREGLNVFDAKTRSFQTFRTEQGLADNTILNLLEDNGQDLWISTPKGISRIILKNDKFPFEIQSKNFDVSDGLQGNEFNEKAALKTKAGELIFGGPNGFNIFDPAGIKYNTNIPPIVFTDFQLFNKSIEAGEKLDKHQILSNAISQTNEITLHHDENIFAIEFAALSFTQTEKNQYAYLLEGFNKEWQQVDNKLRKAIYTNLDPGNYIFRVKASNEDGVWNEAGIALKINILPPFWKTPFAYFIYFLLALIILILSRKIIIQRAGMRFALEQERKEVHRMHELDLMKIRFFTNVSHEFRTPLSLILTPLDKIIKNAVDANQRKQFELIHRNARRLLNLVNQLLDFRKMEVQELKLNALPGDIIKFIKEVSYSFTDIAENKNIRFHFHSADESLFTYFDQDKVERILFNLLSNAFKFTYEKGKVSVELQVQETGEQTVLLKIIVSDTGIGIPREKQDKIFERFFQNEIPGVIVNQGSGIGLAITKEFVKLHEGSITVESEVNKGSCFMVSLPLKRGKPQPEVVLPVPDSPGSADENFKDNESKLLNETFEINEKKTKRSSHKKPVILIVEDNDDFRFYLKDNLMEYFHIEEAANGKDGWQKALALHPDLIVSDISMPEMNGIELCKKIKQDIRTQQIPVILLTALSGQEHQIEGLETGSADYMTKPFNFEIMLSRIRNILSGQEALKKLFTRQLDVKSSEISVELPDEKFIRSALQIVEKHISDPAFSVEQLSRELFISRVSVYKKIFALTGKTPLAFIRDIRMKRAAQLLEKTTLTISEVAYEVGFNNPKYFSKSFKETFNKLPSEYRN